MKIEHIAIAVNSESDSDKFFINLLGLKKIKSFIVPIELTKPFFESNKEQLIIRYEAENTVIEAFVTHDKSKAKDKFTHVCLLINNRDDIVKKATKMGFKAVKVPRKDSDNYYLFIHDSYGNKYEIKEI